MFSCTLFNNVSGAGIATLSHFFCYLLPFSQANTFLFFFLPKLLMLTKTTSHPCNFLPWELFSLVGQISRFDPLLLSVIKKNAKPMFIFPKTFVCNYASLYSTEYTLLASLS